MPSVGEVIKGQFSNCFTRFVGVNNSSLSRHDLIEFLSLLSFSFLFLISHTRIMLTRTASYVQNFRLRTTTKAMVKSNMP